MTASPRPNHDKSPFRVVPPRPAAPMTPPASGHPEPEPKTAAPPVAQAPQSPTVSRRLPLKSLLIAGGLMLAGFIRVPYQVGGQVTLELTEGQRQIVRAPVPAIIEEFYVNTDDEVTVGQPLVRLSSRDLENEIATVEERIAAAQTQFHAAQWEQAQAAARLTEAQAQAQAGQLRADRLQTRLDDLAQGVLPPEVQALVVERDRLQGQLAEARTEWERYQYLEGHGAVSLADMELRAQRYRNVDRDLQAQEAEIRLARQRLADTTADEWSQVNLQQASVTAAHQLAQATERVESHQHTITVLAQRRQQLQQQSAALELPSTQAGTVLDPDLDLRIGEAVTPNEPLLQIADLNQLTAKVEVKQEDEDFVELGATVTFRPDSDKLTAYDATVVQAISNMATDQTQQRRVAVFRVIIDNSEGDLMPNSSGYAKISSQSMPLYRRIGREVIKLWPSKFL